MEISRNELVQGRPWWYPINLITYYAPKKGVIIGERVQLAFLLIKFNLPLTD
jgi:hypothetical protein